MAYTPAECRIGRFREPTSFVIKCAICVNVSSLHATYSLPGDTEHII